MGDYDDDIQIPFGMELTYMGAEDEYNSEQPTIDNQTSKIQVPFSLDSPYLTTGEYEDVPDKEIDLDFLVCDKRYLTPQASEMPTGTAMVGLLRKELAALFHESTATMIRYHRDEFTDKWHSLLGMSAFDETQPTLPQGYFRPGRFLAPERVEGYFNKYIAVYFEHTNNDKNDGLFRLSSDLAGRYLYRHWLRMHHGRPPFQRHHFLAKPIEFVQRGGLMGKEPLVTDLPYVLTFHRSLCDSVAAREDDIKPDNRWKRNKEMKSGVASSTEKKYPQCSPDFCPCLSERPLSYRQHGFRLGHLFRSLFMVVDSCHRDNAIPGKEYEQGLCADYDINPAPELRRYEQRERWINWAVSRHQVLLVKAGDDGHLSTPVSFQPLFNSGRALPVDRENCGSWEDVVRVRLDHALEFVEDLIRREEKALPHVRQAAEALEDELDELCEQWIGRVLEHAAKVGVDNNGFTWQATRRALARLKGEAFDTEQVTPEWEGLARWFPGG